MIRTYEVHYVDADGVSHVERYESNAVTDTGVVEAFLDKHEDGTEVTALSCGVECGYCRRRACKGAA